MEGRIDGKRPKGRKRIGMLSELKEDGYANMKRRTDNRESWRSWMPRRTCQQTEHYIYIHTYSTFNKIFLRSGSCMAM